MTNGPNSMGNLTGIHYNVELNVEVSRNEVLTLLELFISIRLFIMSINVLYTNIVPFTINTEITLCRNYSLILTYSAVITM